MLVEDHLPKSISRKYYLERWHCFFPKMSPSFMDWNSKAIFSKKFIEIEIRYDISEDVVKMTFSPLIMKLILSQIIKDDLPTKYIIKDCIFCTLSTKFIILSRKYYIVLNRKMKNYLPRKYDRDMIALDREILRKKKNFTGKTVF